MRLGVLGAGSLGSLLAGRLSASGTEVVVLGRANDHLRRIQQDGITVETPDGRELVGTVEASSDPRALEGVDAIVLCVKSYDTDQALSVVDTHVTPDTDVVSVQNGLGNVETIADHVPEPRVVAGITTHGATLADPGRVVHAGGGDTKLGRYFAENDDTVAELADRLTTAGIETDVVSNVRLAVWEKVLVNVGINAATALARVPNGDLTDGPGRDLLTDAVEEGATIARAEGVDVPDDIVERTVDVARQTASNQSSMRQDLEAGSRTEVDALNGALIDRAAANGIDAPVNRTLTNLVRLAERRE